MLNVSGVLRGAESCDRRAGFFAARHLAGGFLLLCLSATRRGKKIISQAAFAETACRTRGAAGRREKLKMRCGTKGSPLPPRSRVRTRQILSCCRSQRVQQLPVGCWGSLLAPISPSRRRMDECAHAWPQGSPQREEPGAVHGFFILKTSQDVKEERVTVINNRGGIWLCFLVRFWVSGVNLWKRNCLINFCSTQQVNRRLITVTYPFIAVFLC